MDECEAFFRRRKIKSEDFFSFRDNTALLYTVNLKQWLQVSNSGCMYVHSPNLVAFRFFGVAGWDNADGVAQRRIAEVLLRGDQP
jgi:hypothetical protein